MGAPLGAMLQVTPMLAARTMGRRSSMQRKAAMRACCSPQAERRNQASLVTLTMTCGSGRTNLAMRSPTVSS